MTAANASAISSPHAISGTGTVARSSRILGICWLAYGIVRACAGIFLIAFAPTATVMFGALLARVRDPFAMMTDFHVWYTAVIVWTFACAVLGILAGLALMAGGRAARLLAIVAAVISVPEIPLGTMLGAYTLAAFVPRHD